MKNILLLIIVSLWISDLTFSQTTEPAEQVAAVPMMLPANDVDLTDVRGRTITVEVLSKDANGITTKMADGREIHIAWARLSADSVKKITGKNPEKAPNKVVTFKDNNWNSRTEEVVSVEKDGIIILKDGKETLLTYNELSPYAEAHFRNVKVEVVNRDRSARRQVEQLIIFENGRSQKSPQRVDSKVIKQLEETAIPARKELEKLSVQEIQKLYLEDAEIVKKATADVRARYDDRLAIGLYQDPDWLKYNLSPFDVIPKLEMPKIGKEEKVSLRPEFEKLGVKPLKQVGDTCTQYASYHLAQYLTLKDGGRPPTFHQIVHGFNHERKHLPKQFLDRVPYQQLGVVLDKVYGKRAYSSPLGVGNSKLDVEVAKYHIRQGRPILGSVNNDKGGSHLLVIIGFHTHKNGKTTFEFLDSNRLYVDGGYGHVGSDGSHIRRFFPTQSIAVWFE